MMPKTLSTAFEAIAMVAMLSAAILCASLANAVPATVIVTLEAQTTHDGTGGLPDAMRLYRGCDLATQAVGPIIADPAVIGTPYSFTTDTDNTDQICAVSYNIAGAGPFLNVIPLNYANVVVPPGGTTIVLSCSVDPASGVVADCVQIN